MRPTVWYPLLSLIILFSFLPHIANTIAEPQLIWDYQTTDPIISVHTDGNYVIANTWSGVLREGTITKHIYFLDAGGNLLWRILRDDMVVTSFSTESKFAVAAGRDLYLFDEKGIQTNKIPVVNAMSIAVSQDGSRIVVGSQTSAITLFDNRGVSLWTFKTDNPILAVAISRYGEYSVGNSRTSIYFLGRDGSLRWKYRPEIKEDINDVSMDVDGRYVVATGKDHLFLFNTEGRILWVFDINDIYPAKEAGKVSMSKNGEYIAFNTGDRLVFMNKDKQILWMRDITSISSISMAPDGNYVAIGLANKLTNVGGVSYYRTNLPQPPGTPTLTQTPPPTILPDEKSSVERQKLELEKQAQELEKQRLELERQKIELEKAKQNVSAMATSPTNTPTTPAQSKSVCGPVSVLLFMLFPISCHRLSKRWNNR